MMIYITYNLTSIPCIIHAYDNTVIHPPFFPPF